MLFNMNNIPCTLPESLEQLLEQLKSDDTIDALASRLVREHEQRST